MPSEEIIIADSSPLIGLARIGQLQLLQKLGRRVIAPTAVWVEVTASQKDAPGAREIARETWIEVREADAQVVAPLLVLLGKGEAEAIALAQANPAAVLLLDDLRARKVAERLRLRRMGTVALLGRAKHEGLIQRIKPCIDALLANGIFIHPDLVSAALKEVGE